MSGILTGRLKLSGKIARQYVGRVSGILTGRLKLSGKIAGSMLAECPVF